MNDDGPGEDWKNSGIIWGAYRQADNVLMNAHGWLAE